MRLCIALVVLAASCAASAASSDPGAASRQLKLINRAHDSISALAIAAAGTDDFRDVSLGEPLRGGGDSTVVEIPAASCRYDFRFSFRNGRTLLYKDVDACRISGLRIEPLPSGAGKDGAP